MTLTDFSNSNQATREGEDRYRSLITAISDIDYVMSPDWKIMQQMDGRGFLRDTSEPITNWLETYIYEGDQPIIQAAIAEAIENKKMFQLEHRVKRADGTIGWVLSRAVPIMNDYGEITEWLGAGNDITGQRQMQEALLKSNEQAERQKRLYKTITESTTAAYEKLTTTNDELSATNEGLAENERHLQQLIDELRMAHEQSAKLVAIVESSDDAIIGKNLEGIVTSWNRGAEEIFGYKEAEMIGKSILTVIPEDRQHEEPMILDKLRRGEKIDHYETVRQRSDGTLIDVSLTISPIKDKKGRVIGVSKIARDISEQKRNDQRKNAFIAMASHELKTPLTSLTALIQMLQQRLGTYADPFVPQALEKAVLQTKRMTGMINGFLNVSRLESGQLEIKKQAFDLSALVTSEVEEIRLTASNYEFTLITDAALPIFADKEKIASVITNFLTNAVKYSLKSTDIIVRCFPENGQAILTVQDKGVGIKADDLQRVFDRYYRAEGEHMKQISGFGVGLYLSAEVIRHHGGRIWAESEPGQGSTFYFALPLQEKQ